MFAPHRSHPGAFHRTAGFTLIELVIVVAVIGILTLIAYASYAASIAKSNRKAAEACLSQFANYEEQNYTTNFSYTTTLPALDCASAQQTGSHYAYTATTATTSPFYTITAAPSGSQATNDSKCGTLTLNQTGARGASGSSGVAGCW